MRLKYIITVSMLLLAQVVYGRICIESVMTRCYSGNAFKRISEYFTGLENKGSECIVRTNPKRRGGLYFIITLNRTVSCLPPGCELIFQYVNDTNSEIKTHTFVLNTKKCWSREIWVGLTDGNEGDIVAWKVELRDYNGYLLGERQSYLWGNRD